MKENTENIEKRISGCAQGDSVHTGRVENYKAFYNLSSTEYEDTGTIEHLTREDLIEFYHSVENKMRGMGLKFSSIQDDRVIKPLYVGATSTLNLYSKDKISEREKRANTLKILIKRKSYYDYVSVDTQIVRLGAWIMDVLILHYHDIRFINFLRKKLRSNISKITESYLKPYFSGYVVQDVLCNKINETSMEEVLSVLNNNLDFFNKNLESCEIVKFYQDDNAIMPSDYNLFIGELNRSVFYDFLERYDNWDKSEEDDIGFRVLTPDARASIHTMTKEEYISKSDLRVLIAQKNNKYILTVFTRLNINPYLLVKTLYSKIKITEIYQHSRFQIMGCYRAYNKLADRGVLKSGKELRACSNCGSEVFYNLCTGQAEALCMDCYCRKLLTLYTQRK